MAERSMRRVVAHLMSLCLGLGSGLLMTLPVQAATRPNIVLMLADDWGFSDVGSFGSEIATPNLDALAARGMRFSNFHVSASCSPTRAMLLTGVDNHRNGMGNMRETIPRSHLGRPGYLSVLDRNVVTVATLLQESGYRTQVVGKWHLGKEPHNLPPARGFQRSLVQGDSGSDNWETAKRYLDISDRVYWFEDGRPARMPERYYSSQLFVDRTLDFLREGQGSDQPFFAYLAFQANHIPVQAPRSFIDKYKGRYQAGWHVLREERRRKAIELGLVSPDAPMPPENATTRAWRDLTPEQQAYEARRMEVYAAMAEAMDHHVGRLLSHLRQTGQYDNTVFIFLSDNGPEASDPYAVTLGRWWLDMNYDRGIDQLGDPGAYSIIGPSWAGAAASPLSTYKFYAGEGGIRVPLIIAGVPGMKQGAVHGQLAHVKDLAPTLLALAGVAPPDGQHGGRPVERMTGRSLLPVLQGQAERTHGPDQPIGYELSGNQALFKGDLKIVRNIPPVGDGQWRLFDIVRDPGESNDLAASMPEVFARMKADYEQYAQDQGVLPMPAGYDPIRQVMINAFWNVYVPRLLPWVLVAGVALLGWGVWRRRDMLGACQSSRAHPLP